MEKLVPADITVSTAPNPLLAIPDSGGGILDDLMITHSAIARLALSRLAASLAQEDCPIDANLQQCETQRGDMSLIALQAKGEAVLAKMVPAVRDIPLCIMARFPLMIQAHVSRSGYTGEDGFEISIFDKDAPRLWQLLLANPDVKPIGLGARDSLRLEAGLCLYGHDIDETTSPVEADLLWSIQKRRRSEGGFLGADRVLKEIASGPTRKRVGIKPEGRAPAREGTGDRYAGRPYRRDTSGGLDPPQWPRGMGYVETALQRRALLQLSSRQAHACPNREPPFVPHNYKREELRQCPSSFSKTTRGECPGDLPPWHHQPCAGAVGDVSFVELPAIGAKKFLKVGMPPSLKCESASEVCPLTGEVVAVNKELEGIHPSSPWPEGDGCS